LTGDDFCLKTLGAVEFELGLKEKDSVSFFLGRMGSGCPEKQVVFDEFINRFRAKRKRHRRLPIG